MSKNNKITTKGYFTKRLRDCGYDVWNIREEYPETDNRKWTVLISPKHMNIYCTCYVGDIFDENDSSFEFHDGGQYFPKFFLLKTDSFEVVVEYLRKYGCLPTKSINN